MYMLLRPVFAVFFGVLLGWSTPLQAAAESAATVDQAVVLEKQLQQLQDEQKRLAQQNADFERQLQQAPDLITRMRKQILAMEHQRTQPQVPKDLEALENTIDLLDGQVKAMQLGLSDVMEKISEQQALPVLAREQVVAAQQQVQELNEQLRVVLLADQAVPANSLQVQVIRQQITNATLRKESVQGSLEGYQKLLELYTVNRDLLLMQMGVVKISLGLLRTERDALRQKTAVTQQAQASQLHAALAEKPKPMVTQIEENQRLLTLLGSITDGLSRTNDQIADGKQEMQDIRYRFDIARQQLELTDFHQYVDDYLLRQRQQLQTSIKEHDTSDLADRLSQARLDQFRFDDQVNQIRSTVSRERKIQRVLQKMPDLDESTRQQYAADLEELLDQRQETLVALLEVNAKFVVALTNLELLQQDQLVERQRFFSMLNQKLMWRRSGKPLNLAWVQKMPASAEWLLLHPGWLEVPQSWYRKLVQPVWPLLGLLLVGGVLYGPRKRFISRLAVLRDDIGNVMKDRFRHSLDALAITLYLAMPWPLLLVLLSYPLATDSAASPFVNSVGSILLSLARWVLLVEFVRELCRENGMARVHFNWRPSAIVALQRWLPLLYWQIPLAFLFNLAWIEGDEDNVALLGRAAHILMAVQFWFFLRRLLSPTVGLTQQDAGGESYWYQSWNRQLFWVGMLVPTTTILLALQGFSFSATILHMNLYQTGMLAFMIFVLAQVFTRWFSVQERKIALERALAAREAQRKVREQQEAAKMAGDSVPEVDLPVIDVATLSEQNRVLLRVLSYALFAVAIAWVWQDAFQAVRFFDEVVLWSYTLDDTPGAEKIPVTLGTLIVTLVALVLTYVGAKNLPGLIEVMVLQRFSMDVGLRFAIITIARYLVFIAGTMLISAKIGLDWSKLGWLVAALGVGLGFGLQEIFANFISGLIILFERPIRIGDTVTIGNLSGTVSRIHMRATSITDWDNKELIIPNKTFVTSQFINWTLSDSTTRLVVKIGVAYGTDTQRVTDTLLQIAQAHPYVVSQPAPSAFFVSFGDSALNFELRVFITQFNLRGVLNHELNMAIHQRFSELGIVIAFPQLDVHITELPPGSQADPVG